MNSDPLLYISGEKQDKISPRSLQKAFSIFCETAGLSSSVSASVVFCSSEEMRRINRKYRGADSTTDVISFPAASEPGLYPTDEKGEIFLGEILIDINHILSQTSSNEKYDEIIPVFVHGLLHLTGYDHLNTQQKTTMQNMEQKILKLIRLDGTSE